MYPDKTTDKIMIPQTRYNELLKLEARVDVAFYLQRSDYYISKETILGILGFDDMQEPEETTHDDLTDALGYTE